MTFEELKALDDAYIMHTYARFPVDIDHGEGATLYSLSGRKYIDFTSGIGVNALGYGNEKWMAAITAQIGKLGHISNLFYTQPGALLAKELCTRSGMDKVFFGNSGAEANEAMIKVARKYSFDKYGKGRSTVITLHHSFHGPDHHHPHRHGAGQLPQLLLPLQRGLPVRRAHPGERPGAGGGGRVRRHGGAHPGGGGRAAPGTQEQVQAIAELCRERDWLLLVDEVPDRHRPHRQPLRLPAVRRPARRGLLCQGDCRRAPPGGHPDQRASVLPSSPPVPTVPPSAANPVSTAAGMAVLETLDDRPSWTGCRRRAPTSGQALRPSAPPTWARWWVWA